MADGYLDGINFDCMPCKYWEDNVKISYLQRRIIVHSIIYYEYNTSVVDDAVYDGISHQLVKLQRSVPEDEFKKSMYYYAMHDFDGSTGFDIPSRLNTKDKRYLTQIANNVLQSYKQYRKEK